MIRNLKTLGVALCAVLALSVVVVGSAQAAEGKYTASTYPTTGTAESALGNDVFTTEAGTVECLSHFEGTLTGASTNLTVKAKYSKCKAFGFLEATVSMRSCDYLFTTPTGEKDVWKAEKVQVKCTNALEPILISAGTCKATVGEQTTAGSVDVTNNTAAKDVSVQATVTGVAYTVTEDGFACPFGGTGAKTGATYAQKSSITFASTNGATIDVG